MNVSFSFFNFLVDAVKLCQCFSICGIFAMNSALNKLNPEEFLDCMRNVPEKTHIFLGGISLLVSLLALHMMVPAI